MPRYLIVYQSGTGGTAALVQRLMARLGPEAQIDLIRVPGKDRIETLDGYDAVLFAYPTFYLLAPESMLALAETLPVSSKPLPAFFLTTLSLYCGNSVRDLSRRLSRKNLRYAGKAEIRAPGSDAALVAPDFLIPFFMSYERKAKRKVESLAAVMSAAASGRRGLPRARLPAPKWYGPLARIAQVLYFDDFRKTGTRLRVLAGRCDACGDCALGCRRGAIRMAEDLPAFSPPDCEVCLACVHHCPRKAIVFSEAMADRPRLSPDFHARAAAQAFDA